jgi:hypothetical protein
MNRANFGICIGGQKSEQFMLALYRVRLRAAPAVPDRPDAGEDGERPVFTQREPCRRLTRLGIRVFAKRREGHHAPVLQL